MRPETMRAALARWGTAEAFYRERDDRTSREISHLARYVLRPVEVHIDPAAVHTWTVQAIALIACNLLARWARSIRVVTRDAVLSDRLARDGHAMLTERLLAEMRGADSFGDFSWVEHVAENGGHSTDTLRLFVGPWTEGPIRPGGDDYLINAAGWTALGKRGGELSGPVTSEASISAVGLAAALGVGDVFKRAVGHPRAAWLPSYAWCTWTQEFTASPERPRPSFTPKIPTVQRLGRTLLAGAGAIGSALVYLLDLTPMQGTLGVLDRDSVETSNLNRSPLFRVSHVLEHSHKVDVVRSYLEKRGVEVELLRGSWASLAEAVMAGRFERWISLTNEEGAWAQVPFLLPPPVMHATTTSGWGFGAGRYEPGVDDCTLCRMPRPEARFRGRCAEGEIVENDEPPIRASLPFLSVAAASLLAAELSKSRSGDRTLLPNDTTADLRVGLPAVIALRRGPTSGCRGCRAAALGQSRSPAISRTG